MQTTIDGAGRLVIPREVRREAGIRPGMLLDVRYQDGHVEVEPAPLPVKIEQRRRWLVAIPERKVPPLTVEVVEQTLQARRQERGASDIQRPALPAAGEPGHRDGGAG